MRHLKTYSEWAEHLNISIMKIKKNSQEAKRCSTPLGIKGCKPNHKGFYSTPSGMDIMIKKQNKMTSIIKGGRNWNTCMLLGSR